MTTAKSLNRLWAMSPNKPIRDPGESKYALGWVAEIPTYEVLNYLHNRIDNNILALAERGIFEWGPDIAYKKGALAWDEIDGKIYVALTANPNVSLAPSKNLSQWTASSIQIPKSYFDALTAAINSHITDYCNPHKLTAAQINAYDKAQINTLIGNVQTELNTHKAASNPHGTDADDVGAIPITGGRYTGTVYHDANIIGIGANTTNAVKYEAGKVFFKKGVLEVGIDANGDPYFYDGTKQYLVNEELFVTLKNTYEREYAVPAPDFLCLFQNDINIYAGVGPTSFSSSGGKTYVNKEGVTKTAAVDEPRITVDGLAMLDNTESLYATRTNDGYGFTNYTESIEFFVKGSNAGTTNIFVNNGFIKSKLKITGTTLVAYYTDSAGVQQSKTLTTALAMGKHNFTQTLSGSTLTFYLDGVKISSNTFTLPARTGWTNTQFGLVDSGTNTYDLCLKRFRCWATALTDKQVSTL